MNEILTDARNRNYAAPMFDVSDYTMIRAAAEAANEMKSPVILAGLKPDLEGPGLDYFMGMVNAAVKNISVPVAIHLDHANTPEECFRVIEAGFTSVMIDGSTKPFADNVAITKTVCDFAKKKGITVEAELGHVPDAVAGHGEAANLGLEEHATDLTSPEEVVAFVEQTGVDALAISIGTAHGSYVSTPELDIERLKLINACSTANLVLHGGSGTPSDQLQAAIENGITKVNVYTDIVKAMFGTLKETLNETENMGTWPVVIHKNSIEALKQEVRNKITIFGSANRA